MACEGLWVFLGLGWLFNVLGIGLRMYINARPPITNLFETFIFVAAVGVAMCFFIERINKKGLGLIAGSFFRTGAAAYFWAFWG